MFNLHLFTTKLTREVLKPGNQYSNTQFLTGLTALRLKMPEPLNLTA